MKVSEAEWAILEILWKGDSFALKEITLALKEIKNWNKNTVFTYLKRMAGKGLVSIDKNKAKPYSAAVSFEVCAKTEREELLNRVYDGKMGQMIAAFLKESTISEDEKKRLKKLLDEMEV